MSDIQNGRLGPDQEFRQYRAVAFRRAVFAEGVSRTPGRIEIEVDADECEWSGP